MTQTEELQWLQTHDNNNNAGDDGKQSCEEIEWVGVSWPLGEVEGLRRERGNKGLVFTWWDYRFGVLGVPPHIDGFSLKEINGLMTKSIRDGSGAGQVGNPPIPA